MTYDSLKRLPESETGETADTKRTASKGKRGRKKSDPGGEIAKSEGHRLANQQQSESAELRGGLEEHELALIATRGYQKGQNAAKLELAAMVAGRSDILTDAVIDRIEGLKQALQYDLTNHNPIATLAELGLTRTAEETKEMRDRIEGLEGEDFNRFLL